MVTAIANTRTVGRLFERRETISLTVALSFLVVGFDQFLHTSPTQFGASPAFQLFRWVSDALMALPLFAAAVWAGHLLADRIGLGSTDDSAILKRAVLVSGSLAVFLVPGWFAYNEVAGLTQNTDLVAAHSHALPHSIDAYWVGDTVVYILLLAPLAVVVGSTGYRMATGPRTRLTRTAPVLARWCLVAVLLGGVAATAWFLHQAANHADSSRVYYTNTLQSTLVHSHAFFATGHGAHVPPAGPPQAAAPFSFAYQVARALQDGLIAQAVGLPVAVLMLFGVTRRLRDREQEEVVNR